MAVHFTVRGLAGAQERMRKRIRKLGNMQQANQQVATLMFAWIIRNINAEGRLHNEGRYRWPPLAPATKLARIRKGLSRTGGGRNIRARRSAVPIAAGVTPMLQDTRHMAQSFHFRFTNRIAAVYNEVEYAPIHEEGKGNVPQRKMLPTKKQAIKMTRPVYLRHVKQAVK